MAQDSPQPTKKPKSTGTRTATRVGQRSTKRKPEPPPRYGSVVEAADELFKAVHREREWPSGNTYSAVGTALARYEAIRATDRAIEMPEPLPDIDYAVLCFVRDAADGFVKATEAHARDLKAKVDRMLTRQAEKKVRAERKPSQVEEEDT